MVQPRPYSKIDQKVHVHLCCQPQELSLRATPKAWRGNLCCQIWAIRSPRRRAMRRSTSRWH